MNRSTARTPSRSTISLGAMVRGGGRAAMWTVVALLLLRGLLAGPSDGPNDLTPARGPRIDPEGAAFAVRFARTYLANPTPTALGPYLAEGARVGSGQAPTGDRLAQAEVSGVEDLGGGGSLVTVACQLRDSRVLYLAVPIARSKAGEVAALGAPSIVAAPGPAGVAHEALQPIAGRGAAEIQALVGDFLPAYVSAGDAADLAYFVAPGKEVQPLGGALAVDLIAGVHQVGAGEGGTREVVAGAKLTDPATGATYPVAYRLELTRGARWYVRAVEGASA